MTQHKDDNLDVGRLIATIASRWVVVAACTVIVTVAAVGYVKGIAKPIYSSTALVTYSQPDSNNPTGGVLPSTNVTRENIGTLIGATGRPDQGRCQLGTRSVAGPNGRRAGLDPEWRFGGRLRLLGALKDAATRYVHPAAHLVRWGHRFGLRHVGRTELIDAGDSDQAHRAGHLVFENFQHPDEPIASGRRQSPGLQFAQGDGINSHGQRFDDVASALDATIEHNSRPALHSGHDLGQHVHCSQRMVWLTATMIGDPNDVHAVLNGDYGILGSLNAFEHERQAANSLDGVHRLPGE